MEKFKNTKKMEKLKKYKKIEKQQKVPLMKTWHTGIMVAKKKDFCQEGENLVNRRLLQFMLHLAVHLLAYYAVAFMFFLSCFRFASLMYPWTTS